MNWDTKLLTLKSGEECKHLAKIFLEQPESIPDVINTIAHTNRKIAWRAAWVLDNFSRINPELLIPFVDRFCEILNTTPIQGVRRHLTNILCTLPPQCIEDGRVIDTCCRWIVEEKSDIAVRANAMQLMANLCEIYPELAAELISIIELGMENSSPGIKNRGKKIITSLESLVSASSRQTDF